MSEELCLPRTDWTILVEAICEGLADAEEGEYARSEEQIASIIARKVAIAFEAPGDLGELLICKYFCELFPNYAYTDSHTALDLLRGEVICLRSERNALTDAVRDAHRELIYLAEQMRSTEGGSVRRAIEKCQEAIRDSELANKQRSI